MTAERPTDTYPPGCRVEWGPEGLKRRGLCVAANDREITVRPDDCTSGSQVQEFPIYRTAIGLRRLEDPAPETPAEEPVQTTELVPAGELTGPLSTAEQAELERLEGELRQHLDGMQKGIGVLMEIRDKRLYRGEFDTFEAYVREKWELGKAYANQLIAAEETRRNLLAAGAPVPETERALRPLAGLDPEKQKAAAARAAELAGEGKITSVHTAQAADELKHDYAGFKVEDAVWWIEAGTGRLRAGQITATHRGKLVIRPTDGGGPDDVMLDPMRCNEGEPPTPPEPFGRCLCGQIAESPKRHREQGVSDDEQLCPGCLSAKAALQRTAQMAAAAGLSDATGAIQTAAGLFPVADPVEEVSAESLSVADQTAAMAATPAVDPQPEPAPAPKPNALKSAEEIAAEKAGGAGVVPSTIGAAVLDGPVQMAMVLEDCVNWLRSDGLNVKTFLGRLKAAAYHRGLTAAELLAQLENA